MAGVVVILFIILVALIMVWSKVCSVFIVLENNAEELRMIRRMLSDISDKMERDGWNGK